MYTLARNLTILLVLVVMFLPYPQVTEAKHDIAGSVPNIELRGARKPHKDRVKKIAKPVAISGNCKQVYQLAKEVGATDREAEILTYIADKESTCGANKVSNVSYALGLWQWLPDSWGYMCKGNRKRDKDQAICTLNVIREGGFCNTWIWWWPKGRYDGRFGSCAR